MNALLRLSPSDLYVAWLVSVLVQSTAVLIIAWILASLLARRNAAARYATWLAALSLLALSPLTGYLAVSSRVSLVEVSLPQRPLYQPAMDLPAVVPPAMDLQAVTPPLPELVPPPIARPSSEFSFEPTFDEEAFAVLPNGRFPSDHFAFASHHGRLFHRSSPQCACA